MADWADLHKGTILGHPEDIEALFEAERFISPADPIASHLAWAAGFWDGEGTVSARDNSSGGRQIKAMISQKDRRLLDHFTEVTRLGKVYPRHTADFWFWQVARVKQVRELARILWPWLGEIKRDQFLYAFGAYELLRHERR